MTLMIQLVTLSFMTRNPRRNDLAKEFIVEKWLGKIFCFVQMQPIKGSRFHYFSLF